MPSASKPARLSLKPGPGFVKYLLAILSLLILANGGLALWLERGRLAEEREILANESREEAHSVAAAVANKLKALRGSMQDVTRWEGLSEALPEQGDVELQALQKNLDAELEGLRTVRVFQARGTPLGIDESGPALRFSELDMMNRAGRREEVLPESWQVDDEWRINLVEPIPFAGDEQAELPVSGLLLVAVAAGKYLLPEGLVSGKGQVQILQQYPGQTPQQLLGPREIHAQAGEAAVAGSYFHVRFNPSPAMVEALRVSPISNYLIVALSTLVSIAVAVFLAVVTSRRFGTEKPAKQQFEELAVDDLLSLEVTKNDTELLGLASFRPRPKARAEDPLDIRDPIKDGKVPAEIFRSYDIRGRVPDQLGPGQVALIGRAIGSAALAAGENTLVVARDGRTHSPEVAEQLVQGILATGCDVMNIGLVPSPVLYFACQELQNTSSGVMVTASHNPPEYNGFKVVIKGDALKDDEIQRLHSRIDTGDFEQGAGNENFTDLSLQYIDRIFSDLALAGEMSVVVDAGNGAAGKIAPRLFEELGCRVTPLFCDIDGRFPNHPPDPSIAENLQALQDKVKETGADLGIALDGDGDRVSVVTASGRIVPADRLLMLLAKDVVARNPGADVVFDVKCSRELNRVISSYGGRPIMWKAGHSHIKAKMRETGALLGGELSGHIFIKERWYGFDDGLYAAARLLEIMSLREEDLDSILENFPVPPATPEIRITVPERQKFSLVERLIEEGDFGSGRVTTIDGLRVDYPEGWGLVRASNTSPAITLRFEGENEDALKEVVGRFEAQLIKIDPQLTITF